MEHFHLLPFQKSYHIFMFNDRKSELDRLWVSDVIKNLEYYGFKGGCISDDFDIEISVFKNIQRKIKQSIITAFVISENSLKSKSFTNNMENAVMLITESDEEHAMVPILLNDSEMPICLRNYHPLIVTDRREDWWPKLLRVLENHILCSSSSGESDEDIRNLIEECKKTLAIKSIKKQKKFRQLCKQSGISQFTSQMGTRTMHASLLKGCGVEIVDQCLILKWDRFENVMIENRDTLVSIVHFNQACTLREVVINLTEEGHDKLIKGCPIWQSNLTTFIEKSLNYDFYTGIDDRMTYDVKFEGHTNYALLHSVNNIVRNLYLENFKARCCQLDTTEKRIETFKNWPYDKRQILIFAEAGFIYTGHLDTVTCYACNQSLYGSSKEDRDSLMGQHVQWSSDCSFLNIQTDSIVLDLLKQKRRSQSILDATDSYSPYACDDKMTLSQITRTNESAIIEYNLNINGTMLAEIGFTIVSPTEPDVGVVCSECNYIKYGFKDIHELESCHLMWSGEQCQFLIRTKGIKAIQIFREDNDLRIQYKSSVSFKTIMINRNQ
ncbi:uncharacterized protein LOC134692938 [Mytilus trossulus]|uniref:uncharacterized protein LOC134692938 n=1 Tax=Mytilus trossulus TaxID=6551 RepID=UPI00300632B7